MAFNIQGLLRFIRIGLFQSRNTNYRLTPKRIAWLLTFVAVGLVLELSTWFCFFLDNLLFPGHRDQEIREPVLIIGNPRSGTTFLHRLMAADRQSFCSMKAWEIFFSPSILQRKFVMGIASLDKLLGGPGHKLVGWLEAQYIKNLVTHEFRLGRTEEDEFILIHAWSTLAIGLFSGVLDKVPEYTRFDQLVAPEEKQRIMSFYKGCLQRHLYAHRKQMVPHTRYLAKSPATTPKVDTFYEWFPDIKFIYLVRNPTEMLPSYMSCLQLQWRILADPLTGQASRDYTLDMARHWYTYPLERFDSAPQDSYLIVNYDDLVGDPEGTVAEIYRHFGLEMSKEYAAVLHEQSERARGYRSRHHYSLEEWNLTQDEIVEGFRDIFERFGFDTGIPMEPEPDQKRSKRRGRRRKRKPRLANGMNRPPHPVA